jgi:methylated-DNA-[protein]-cysteine S-methyltransferase
MHLRLERWASPVSTLLIVTDEADVLRALYFGERDVELRRVLQSHYGTFTLSPGPIPDAIKRLLEAYFEGALDAIDTIPVATGGTPFQQQVWKALRSVPAGRTATYGHLAAIIGREGASRAVGAANGANPISIVVPCHRVVGASGALTGYGGGLENKRWLLAHEARHSPVLAGP